MIPYMVGKLAPNSTHFTRGLVKYVPGRGYFRAVSSQNGDSLSCLFTGHLGRIQKLEYRIPTRCQCDGYCHARLLGRQSPGKLVFQRKSEDVANEPRHIYLTSFE